jgi:hypothetical protein
MQVIERLATRIDSLGMSKKRSIMGGDLNLSYADSKGNVDVTSRGRLVWENRYAQVVNGATRGAVIMDVYFVRPESMVNSCTIEQGISDHCAVLLEVDWEENYCRPEVERLAVVYIETNILGLCTFLWEKFSS